jgi:uncharacterized protein (TIGR03546 family)
VSTGFALGMILGLVPANPLIIVLLFFLVAIFRINFAATLLAWGVLKFPAYLLDSLFDKIGFRLLTLPSLQALFTKLYNAPVFPWSHFNNTVVAGSLFTGVVLFVPTLFLSHWLVNRYRESVWRRFTNSKAYKALQSTKLYQLYEKYQGVKGALS